MCDVYTFKGTAALCAHGGEAFRQESESLLSRPFGGEHFSPSDVFRGQLNANAPITQHVHTFTECFLYVILGKDGNQHSLQIMSFAKYSGMNYQRETVRRTKTCE